MQENVAVEGGALAGRVAGTADATPLVWHIAVSPDQFLQLDDVVVTTRDLPEVLRSRPAASSPR